MSKLQQLLDAIGDPDTPLSSLLLRARALARELGSEEFERWVDKESKGYVGDRDVPSYRTIQVAYKGQFHGPFNSGTKNVPLDPGRFDDPQLQAALEQYTLRHSIVELEQLASSESAVLSKELPSQTLDVFRTYGPFIDGQILNHVDCFFARSQIVAVVFAIRARFQDFLLALQKTYPHLKTSEPSAKDIHSKDVDTLVDRVLFTEVINQSESNEGVEDMDKKKAVFVIHGRNGKARAAMFEFLRALGLNPLQWSQIVAKTGKSSPYIGEILDVGFSLSQAVIALMTPDDIAMLRTELHGADEPSYETGLTHQPRQNVIFEAGMAMGREPNRTVIVEFGKLRPMSDIVGRHVIRMDGAAQSRREIATRLQSAGCTIDWSGDDWLTSGDFTGALLPVTAEPKDAKEEGFMQYLEGLSGDELYFLASGVADASQTLQCYPGDIVPQSLAEKGFLRSISVRQSLAAMQNREPTPQTIPTPVWRYLNENKSWLHEQVARKNTNRADRLKRLGQWLSAGDKEPTEQT